MSEIIQGMIGGAVPAIIMAFIYLMTTEKRLSRMETNIEWLKREVPGCRPHSAKDSG